AMDAMVESANALLPGLYFDETKVNGHPVRDEFRQRLAAGRIPADLQSRAYAWTTALLMRYLLRWVRIFREGFLFRFIRKGSNFAYRPGLFWGMPLSERHRLWDRWMAEVSTHLEFEPGLRLRQYELERLELIGQDVVQPTV